jgi:quercetin dioxygenase-like cupin family protein
MNPTGQPHYVQTRQEGFMADTQQTAGGYLLTKEAGVTDIWFPPTGGRYTFKVGPEQTDGRLLQVLCSEPRGAAPPLHIHHDADETLYVLDGRVDFLVGNERIETGPGDFAVGPKGIPHAFLVTSERAEFLATFAPGGVEGPGGFGLEGFFREIGIPVIPGEDAPIPLPPDPEQFARTASAYAIEIIGPPPTLQD